MDRSTPLWLIPATFEQNENGEYIEAAKPRKVYCSLRSVSRAEWSEAGQHGLRAEYQATMFAPDYNGEESAELALRGGKMRFSIYRTYLDANENIELYLGNRVGESDLGGGNGDPSQ